MRIIAGEFRGRRLLDPADQETRPITDRVKQSLFDVLSPRLAGAQVWDVFAGTGSLGLEALSRGSAACVFFERHRPAAQRLERNIATLGVGDRCWIVAQDVLALKVEDLAPLPPADLVFFDPPYPLVREQAQALQAALMRFAAATSPDGLIVLRLEDRQAFRPPLVVADERKWGSMRVLLLEPSAAGC